MSRLQSYHHLEARRSGASRRCCPWRFSKGTAELFLAARRSREGGGGQLSGAPRPWLPRSSVSYRETEIHNSLLGFWLAVVSRGFFYLWFGSWSFPGEVAPSHPRLFTLPWSSCVKIRDCQTFFISPSLALETCVNKIKVPQ